MRVGDRPGPTPARWNWATATATAHLKRRPTHPVRGPFVSVPVTILAALNLVVAWRSEAPQRRWWLTGAVLMCGYAVASYGFFVPRMLALQAYGASWPAAEIESMVGLWTTLNWARMVLGAAGWLCALRALSLSRVVGGVAGLPTPGRNRWDEGADHRSA